MCQRVQTLLLFTLPLSAQYSGPAILTRGQAPSALSSPQIDFRPFVEATGTYDTGLAGVTSTPNGDLANASSFGVGLAWGVSGTHSWRHTLLGLDYRGGTYHYFHQTQYDGIDQSLLLGITHQLTRRMTLSLRESAGMFTRDFGLQSLPQTVPFDPSTTFIPTTDYFDNRTIYLTTAADLTIQKTSRLSFDMGGMGFINRRRSTALYGVVGAYAHGDVQYRLTRRTTVGIDYSYEHFDYTRVFGGTDFHAIQAAFARQLSRYWEFSGYAGGGRVESKFIQVVPIDPTLAALLGISASSEIVHGVRWVPNMSGRLSRAFPRGVAYIAAGRTITPGNGVFLTSAATQVFGGYTYTGLRRWSFAAEVSYARARSLGNIEGVYSSTSGSLTASRQIIRTVHFLVSYSARHYDSPDLTGYNRVIYAARVGIGFTPGDVPLRIW
jgi:hypothetical protein